MSKIVYFKQVKQEVNRAVILQLMKFVSFSANAYLYAVSMVLAWKSVPNLICQTQIAWKVRLHVRQTGHKNIIYL